MSDFTGPSRQVNIEKENATMSRQPVSKGTLILLFVGLFAVAALVVTIPKVVKANESDERSGMLHVTKECSNYDGNAGTYCTITSSNIPEITAGSQVFYTQAPTADTESTKISLDSNVILYVGTGDWATGRCTLDLANRGICTFSDGTGQLTRFHARVDVAPTDALAINYSWNGTYSFGSESGN
jgi:hypothetical protein